MSWEDIIKMSFSEELIRKNIFQKEQRGIDR
jgi:hypothetical protein